MTLDSMWDILDRYFSGACTPDELAHVERRLAEDQVLAEQVCRARRVWDATGPMLDGATRDAKQFDARAAWVAVRARSAPARGAHAARPRLHLHAALRPGPSRRRWWPSAIAAAATILAAVAGGIWWRAAGGARTGGALDGPMREYATTKGQRAEIVLVDGTRVTLNVESRLRVPLAYGARSRDVVLDGEAFFQVQHNKVPFRVHARHALAEDLGTAFVVRAYPEDSGATVVVTEGAVALRASAAAAGAGRGVALRARQLGRIDASNLVSVISDVNVDRYLAWRHAQLSFARAPLARVVRELERWYDVDITLGDTSLATVPVTGAFRNTSLDGVLADIAASLDLRYTRQGARVVFLPNERAR